MGPQVESVFEILHPRITGVYLLSGQTSIGGARLGVKYYIGESEDLVGRLISPLVHLREAPPIRRMVQGRPAHDCLDEHATQTEYATAGRRPFRGRRYADWLAAPEPPEHVSYCRPCYLLRMS